MSVILGNDGDVPQELLGRFRASGTYSEDGGAEDAGDGL
jgi:hypothetical protein